MDLYGDVYISYQRGNQIHNVRIFSHLLKKCKWFNALIEWNTRNTSSVTNIIDITQTCKDIDVYPDLGMIRSILTCKYTEFDNNSIFQYEIEYFDTLIFLIFICELDKDVLSKLYITRINNHMELDDLFRKLCIIDTSYKYINICDKHMYYDKLYPCIHLLDSNHISGIIDDRSISDDDIYEAIYGEKPHKCIYLVTHYLFDDSCGNYAYHKLDSDYIPGYYCDKHIDNAVEENDIYKQVCKCKFTYENGLKCATTDKSGFKNEYCRYHQNANK